jgi:hypothetical protein
MAISRVKEDSICLNCGCVFKRWRTSFGKYCSNACQYEYQTKQKFQDYMENQDSYNGKDMDWIYKYILEEQNHKCAICGLPDIYNDKPYTMILNHIDKDKSNNHRDNLRLICPNCYSFIRKRKNN